MRILLPIDGSLYSRRAVEYICTRSDLKDKTTILYLLNVQKKVPPKARAVIQTDALESVLDEEAKATLRPAKKALENAGYKVKTRVAYGKASNKIVDFAEEMKANLIVMGSHGHTPVKNVLFGSKTAAVIAATEVPMLVLRHQFKGKSGDMNIGICLDGSSYSESVIQYVDHHLSLFGKKPKFFLINAVVAYSGLLLPGTSAFGAPSMTPKAFEDEQRAPFEAIALPTERYLKEKGYEVDIVRLKGDPANEIAKFATENDLSLLVMGTHGGGAMRIMMVGSTTMRVAALTDLPLLLIHQDSSRYFRKSKKTEKA